MSKMKGKMILLALGVLFSTLNVHAQDVIVKGTAKNYSDEIVTTGSSASVYDDQQNDTFDGIMESNGQFSVTVPDNTGVEDYNSQGSSNSLAVYGNAVHCNVTQQGTAYLRNLLGQTIGEYKLKGGQNNLNLADFGNPNLANNSRYFIIIETPNYKAVARSVCISGQLIGQYVEVKRDLSQKFLPSPEQGSMAKTTDGERFLLQIIADGYDNFQQLFNAEDFDGYEDIARMNMIPTKAADLPTTVSNDYNLNPHVNDDNMSGGIPSGTWEVDNNLLHIINGILSVKDASQSVNVGFSVIYRDPVNPDLSASLDGVMEYEVEQPTLFGIVKSMIDPTQVFPNAHVVAYPVGSEADSVSVDADANGNYSSLDLPGPGTYCLMVRQGNNTRIQKVAVNSNNDMQADILYVPGSYDAVFGASILMKEGRIVKFADYAAVNYFIVNEAGRSESDVTLAEDKLIEILDNISNGTYQLQRGNIQHGDPGNIGNRFLFKYRTGSGAGSGVSLIGDFIDKGYSYTTFSDWIGIMLQEMLGAMGLHGEPRGWLAQIYDNSETIFNDGTTRTDLNEPIDQQTFKVYFYMPVGGKILPFKNGVEQAFNYLNPPQDNTLEWRFIDKGL